MRQIVNAARWRFADADCSKVRNISGTLYPELLDLRSPALAQESAEFKWTLVTKSLVGMPRIHHSAAAKSLLTHLSELTVQKTLSSLAALSGLIASQECFAIFVPENFVSTVNLTNVVVLRDVPSHRCTQTQKIRFVVQWNGNNRTRCVLEHILRNAKECTQVRRMRLLAHCSSSRVCGRATAT